MELTFKSALTEKLSVIMHLPSLINSRRHPPEHCVPVKESAILLREACLGCFQVERDAHPRPVPDVGGFGMSRHKSTSLSGAANSSTNL